ncbi:MAG: sulfotransferase [Bacteroidetes bacterium]|nr:sulfotransferase [Bacteroidota bacterium]
MAGQEKMFFIVGNSRSGTTMMLRILNLHPEIYGLNELHFFENLWSSSDKDRNLTQEQAAILASKLLYVQREGYIGKTEPSKYLKEGEAIARSCGSSTIKGHEVFRNMMLYETNLNGKKLPCEKTPQNVFYLSELFELFPAARVINMIRDPRAVMLSQKRKWRRRKMGAAFITRWEVLRLRINYHPITLSRLWNAAIRAVKPFKDDERLLNIHFEDMLNAPEQTVRSICEHLGVQFNTEMLDIPQASSSNEADSKEKGINKSRAGNWKKGGLNNAEIHWTQSMSGTEMKANGYQLEPVKASPIVKFLYALTFPVKLILAVLMNLNRMKNIFETLKKRMR